MKFKVYLCNETDFGFIDDFNSLQNVKHIHSLEYKIPEIEKDTASCSWLTAMTALEDEFGSMLHRLYDYFIYDKSLGHIVVAPDFSINDYSDLPESDKMLVDNLKNFITIILPDLVNWRVPIDSAFCYIHFIIQVEYLCKKYVYLRHTYRENDEYRYSSSPSHLNAEYYRPVKTYMMPTKNFLRDPDMGHRMFENVSKSIPYMAYVHETYIKQLRVISEDKKKRDSVYLLIPHYMLVDGIISHSEYYRRHQIEFGKKRSAYGLVWEDYFLAITQSLNLWAAHCIDYRGIVSTRRIPSEDMWNVCPNIFLPERDQESYFPSDIRKTIFHAVNSVKFYY